MKKRYAVALFAAVGTLAAEQVYEYLKRDQFYCSVIVTVSNGNRTTAGILWEGDCTIDDVIEFKQKMEQESIPVRKNPLYSA